MPTTENVQKLGILLSVNQLWFKLTKTNLSIQTVKVKLITGTWQQGKYISQ